MFKRIIYVLLFLFVSVNAANADMKYTKITSMDGNLVDKSAPPEIIQGIKSDSNKTETIYIKGNNIRVDNLRFPTSTVTMCDKQQMIHLEHDIKKYIISPLNNAKTLPNKPQPEAIIKKVDAKKQFKTNVTDTKKQEKIGEYNTHKYIVNMSMPEDDSLFKDMNRIEEIWVSDIKDQMPVCNLDSIQKAMPSGLIVKKTVTANDPFSKGKIKSTVLIKDISTTPIPDSTFQIPKGYTKLTP